MAQLLTGGPRSPVFARATGPSRSSSVVVSAVASRNELVPRGSPLSLKVHSSLEVRGAGVGGRCRTIL